MSTNNKVLKKDMPKMWISLPQDVLDHYEELADLDGRKRKDYIEKQLIRDMIKLKTSLTKYSRPT